MRKQRVVLEHDADTAAVGRQVIDALAVEQHAALRLADEAGNDAQQGGLAAAGRSQQRNELAGANRKLHGIDGEEISEAMG